MAKPDLKPCPFCGGGANYVKHSAGVPRTMGFDSWDAVACRACGATVGACDRRFRNRDDAAVAWNLRPSTSSLASVTADEVTDEMIDAACAAVSDLYRVDAVRAIEAALSAAAKEDQRG